MDNIEEGLETSSNFINKYTYDWLIHIGVPRQSAAYVNLFVLLVLLILLVYLVQWVVRKLLTVVIDKVADKTNVPFFDYLRKNRFPHYLALIAPISLIKSSIHIVFDNFPKLIAPLDTLVEVYMVLMTIWIIMSILKSGADSLRHHPVFEGKPLDSYLQVIRMVLYLFAAVAIFSIVTKKNPTAFFAAMGAASAVLLLMFKDTIMGFVASIQVTTNDMVRIGDWITMPKYGADGSVTEINLTTVKVQNFDKTITTIPTYSLISDSFQNWRGMQQSGGRRIKRAIIIKQNSIRFVKDDELEKYKKIEGLANYIETKGKEIERHNQDKGLTNREYLLNGRNFTNFGLFRKYAEWYLQNHPGLHKDMTTMVRQMAPTETGIPLELYAFTNTVVWLQYEYIMADIFDHLIASVKYFDLLIFESAAGTDIIDVHFDNAIPAADAKKENSL
ncbi:mechanosensitive ion channel family protein [Olivibacter sitiensis]|uniref:mechanosensitive ion channel family protein n=1 Tax=Olivibacter sitiensis TaxID=376470 RepID=UPI0004033908|nr:mechanosensitive ion channel domain-containing protein [Olivibacter sitiensis]